MTVVLVGTEVVGRLRRARKPMGVDDITGDLITTGKGGADMNQEDNSGGSGRAVAGGNGGGREVSRRAFIQGLSAIGAGTVFFSGAVARRARAQNGAAGAEGRRHRRFLYMYTDMLKIRLWETKIKDLILAGGFRGVSLLCFVLEQ